MLVDLAVLAKVARCLLPGPLAAVGAAEADLAVLAKVARCLLPGPLAAVGAAEADLAVLAKVARCLLPGPLAAVGAAGTAEVGSAAAPAQAMVETAHPAQS
eukprot:SAG31_NODE_2_length_46263_cov_45.908043_10_plen_101_part_00